MIAKAFGESPAHSSKSITKNQINETRKLMALSPAIESALQTAGILLVDELERELHPMLNMS